MIELKDFINELDYIDQYIYKGIFYNKDYEKDNHKFKLCYQVAENLKYIDTIKMIEATNILKILPALYVEIILDIATKLKPKNKAYYKKIKQALTQIYVKRFKDLLEKDEIDLLFCKKPKHRKKYLNLQERVIDVAERIDIILALDYDALELSGKYKGEDKTKIVLSDLYKLLMYSTYKKLEDLKEKTFEPAVNMILENLNKTDEIMKRDINI